MKEKIRARRGTAMPVLTEESRERFARLVAEGVGQKAAYREVFGDTMVNNTVASALTRVPEVAARIAELLEELAQEAVWALTERLEYLREVAMTPYEEVDASSPLCLGTRYTPRGVEHRTPDKLEALALYCRLVGDFRPEAATKGLGPSPMLELICAVRNGDLEKASAIERELKEMGAWTVRGHSEVEEDSDQAATASVRPALQNRMPRERVVTPQGQIWIDGRYIGECHGGETSEEECAQVAQAPEPPLREFRRPPRKPGEPLANARHERFAHHVARGETYTDALMKVYRLSREIALGNMTRISHRPEVQERIAELRARAAHSVNWTIPQRLLYLKRLVLTPLEQVTLGSPYCQGIWRYPKGLAVRIPNKLRAIELYSRLAATLNPPKGRPTKTVARR